MGSPWSTEPRREGIPRSGKKHTVHIHTTGRGEESDASCGSSGAAGVSQGPPRRGRVHQRRVRGHGGLLATRESRLTDAEPHRQDRARRTLERECAGRPKE